MSGQAEGRGQQQQAHAKSSPKDSLGKAGKGKEQSIDLCGQ